MVSRPDDYASSVRRALFLRLGNAFRRRRRRRAVYSVVLEGMPEVHLTGSPVAPREYIPWPWVYMPVVIKWFALAFRYRGLTLPTAANPYISSGGFRGKSKASYLSQIGAENRPFIARWTTASMAGPANSSVNRLDIDAALARARLGYPLVVKPDIGMCGHGVRLVHDRGELCSYVRDFPAGQTLILQEFVPWAGEAGIFYVRHPGAERGRIYSLALRYYPHVTGDGRSTLRQLIRADPRVSRTAKLHLATFAERLDEVPEKGAMVRLSMVASLRVGSLYRNGSAHVTPALEDRIDAIARSMPEFYYGRFDVRFRNVGALGRGEDFRIVEVNGAGAEAIHIWDPELTLADAYRTWFEQHEILFDIAAANRARGVCPISLRQFLGCLWREARLRRHYPASN